LVLAATPLLADHFWNAKPSAQWNHKEAVKVLEDSPWSRQVIRTVLQPEKRPDLGVDRSSAHCDPDALNPNGDCMQPRMTAGEDPTRSPRVLFSNAPSRIFLVRWESATPVVEAFQRLDALGERATAQYLSAPPRLPADRYVVTVKLFDPGKSAGNVPGTAGPVDPFGPLQDAKGNSRASLRVGKVTVAPAEAERTGVGAAEAVHFYFPRIAAGVPLLRTGQEVRAEFEFRGEAVSLKTHFVFDPHMLR
jgi:hypothetical protein